MREKVDKMSEKEKDERVIKRECKRERVCVRERERK